MWILLPFLNDYFDIDFKFAGLLGTPLYFFYGMTDDYVPYIFNVIIYFGIILLAQWAFLRPGRNFKVNIAEEGRPILTSVFAAGLMASLLTIGLIALILELPDWWEKFMQTEENNNTGKMYVWAVMIISWCVWTWVFWVYWKQGGSIYAIG